MLQNNYRGAIAVMDFSGRCSREEETEVPV